MSAKFRRRDRGPAATLCRLILTVGLIAGLLAAPGVATAQDQTQTTPPEGNKYDNLIKVRTSGGVVVSESPQASQAGINVLNAGGNAVDAAIATTFAIGVTRPEMCGIGGGGFLLYRGADGSTAALDFRESSPAAVDQNTFNQGSSDGGTSKLKPGIHTAGIGHTVVGVPGVVAGMDEAFQRLGSGNLEFAELIADAERYAREGIKVSNKLQLSYFFDATFFGAHLYNYPETVRIYGPGWAHGPNTYPFAEDPTAPGEPAEAAAFKQEDYAKSLRQIMEHGAEAFYEVHDLPASRGKGRPKGGTPSIGKLLVADMATAEEQGKLNPVLLARTAGQPNDVGLIEKDDLEDYEPKWKTPLIGQYRDHEVITMPPPSGGMVVLETLNLLENFDLGSFGHSSTDHIHALAEAQKLAWADRNEYLADPDFEYDFDGDGVFEPVPTDVLTSEEYAQRRVAEIDMAKAKSVAQYGPGTLPPSEEGTNTTHLSVIDSQGNAASVTCSLEALFGSGVVAPGTGFLLNSQLSDFDETWPDDQPAPANAPGGGKRPRSSQSPTIVVKDGHPVLVTGGAGGPTIIGGVVQNILNVVDFDLDIFRAIDAARVDSVGNCASGLLMLESRRIDDTVETQLVGRGHVLCRKEPTGPLTVVPPFAHPITGEPVDYALLPLIASAGTDLLTGERLGVSDPRALQRDNYDQGPCDTATDGPTDACS